MDKAGRITHYVAVNEDITQRKQTEEMLRQQAQIIAQIHDSVIATDLDGYVISWNNAATRLYGHAPEEALGKHITFLYPKEEHEFVLNHVIGPVKKKGSHDVEVRSRQRPHR